MASIETLTGEILLNKRAAKFASAIPARADIGALVDLYARLVSHSCEQSKARALAIEHHIRSACIVRPDVFFLDVARLDDIQKGAEKARRMAKRKRRR